MCSPQCKVLNHLTWSVVLSTESLACSVTWQLRRNSCQIWKYIDLYVQKQNTKHLEIEIKWLNKTNLIKICPIFPRHKLLI